MPKPFDSKVEFRRDDDEPYLEFSYRGTRMGPQQLVGFVLVLSFGAIPLAPIPWLMSRRQNRVRLDIAGITRAQRRRGRWKEDFYPRERVSRVRTATHSLNNTNPGKTAQVVFDYGTKAVVLFQNLSEPELLWMHNEVQGFVSRHWTEPVDQGRL